MAKSLSSKAKRDSSDDDYMSTYSQLFRDLELNPPAGWRVIHHNTGVYLWPESLCEFRKQPPNPQLRDWEILFQCHRTAAGSLRIIARARLNGPTFECIKTASAEAHCKQPRQAGHAVETIGVAIWQIGTFGNDSAAIARRIRSFLTPQPKDLKDFIHGLKGCCSDKQAKPGCSGSPTTSLLASRTKGVSTSKGFNRHVQKSGPPPHNGGGDLPPRLNANAPADDVLKAFVKWIHHEPFQRVQRHAGLIVPVGGAPEITGWEGRMQQYAYATNHRAGTNFADVFPFRDEMLARIILLRKGNNWINVTRLTDLGAADQNAINQFAKDICVWGGVRQQSYDGAWRVIKSAMEEAPFGDARMNSGWTKVASFATDGLNKPQTIWDSRVSTSIIWRIDAILHANGRNLNLMAEYDLGIIKSRPNAGRRDQRVNALHLQWPNAYGVWKYHFGGSAVVRRIAEILNDPQNDYPRMPLPRGGHEAWNVFGVGLVLFMDGY